MFNAFQSISYFPTSRSHSGLSTSNNLFFIDYFQSLFYICPTQDPAWASNPRQPPDHWGWFWLWLRLWFWTMDPGDFFVFLFVWGLHLVALCFCVSICFAFACSLNLCLCKSFVFLFFWTIFPCRSATPLRSGATPDITTTTPAGMETTVLTRYYLCCDKVLRDKTH